MSRVRTGIKPGQWADQGPAAATVKAGHIQGSLVIGASSPPPHSEDRRTGAHTPRSPKAAT